MIWGLFVGLAVLSGESRAAIIYRYTFQYDAISYQNVQFAASTFSFDVPSIIVGGNAFLTVNQVGSLNGFTTSKINYSTDQENLFSSYPDFSRSVGSVGAFAFAAQTSVLGVGTYESQPGVVDGQGSNGAGRGIVQANGNILFYYTSGRLVVSAVNSVPEPSSLALCGLGGGLGLLGAAAARRHKPKVAATPSAELLAAERVA